MGWTGMRKDARPSEGPQAARLNPREGRLECRPRRRSAPQTRCDDEDCAAELPPHALLFATWSPVRQERITQIREESPKGGWALSGGARSLPPPGQHGRANLLRSHPRAPLLDRSLGSRRGASPASSRSLDALNLRKAHFGCTLDAAKIPRSSIMGASALASDSDGASALLNAVARYGADCRKTVSLMLAEGKGTPCKPSKRRSELTSTG